MSLLLVLACTSDPKSTPDAAGGDADADADADSDADVDAGTVSATCAVQADNALRVDCDIEVDPPAAVELAYGAADGGPQRTVRDDTVGTSHRLSAWRMTADTTYDYVVSAVDVTATTGGSWTTGPLPGRAQLELSTTGTSERTEDVLLIAACDGPEDPAAVVFAPDGQVVWYQDLEAGLDDGRHTVEGIAVTIDGRVATQVDSERVRLFEYDGTLALDAVRGTAPGFDRYVHHDLFARDGLVYALNADVYSDGGTDYVTDGIYVMDEATGEVLGEWDVSSYQTPSGGGPPSNFWNWAFPGAIDWSHGNGLYVDADLQVYLSLLMPSTVLHLDGDPASPTFGTVHWKLVGDPASFFAPSDLVLDGGGVTSDVSFEHQHHPTFDPAGNLMLFDNHLSPPSRVLQVALDEAGGTATIVAATPLPAHCPILGSAFVLDNGHLLAYCAEELTFYELDAGTANVIASNVVSCTNGLPPFGGIPRTIPIAL